MLRQAPLASQGLTRPPPALARTLRRTLSPRGAALGLPATPTTGDRAMRTLTLTAVLALVATGAFAQEVVRMGTEGGYPPYNFINDQGEPDGFEIELGNALCERA